MEELLVRYRPTKTPRSADKGVLVQTKYNLKTYSYRAFSHTAPTHMLWAGRFQIKNQNISFKRAFQGYFIFYYLFGYFCFFVICYFFIFNK